MNHLITKLKNNSFFLFLLLTLFFNRTLNSLKVSHIFVTVLVTFKINR
jgi:hypothetical protein